MMPGDKIPDTVEECSEKPKFWDNNEKINSWFTTFRSRDLNPLNYDNKMNYWKSNVDFFCEKTKNCVLSLRDLNRFFLREGKTPTCLSTVLEAMLRDGTLLTESDFEKSLANNTWSGWTMNALYNNPKKWLSKTVVSAVSIPDPEIDESSKFLHMQSLKKRADDLLKYVTREVKNGLVTYETVKRIYSQKVNPSVDMHEIRLLVQWLVHEKKANITYEQKHLNTHLLKFAFDSKPVEQIDESEITVFCLNEQEKNLSVQIEQYEKEVTNLIAEVKNRLKQGQKSAARGVLRKKKEIERRIDKLSKALENIQTLLYTVEESESDKQIIKTYQAGAKTLKSKFTIGDLNLSQVDNTMSEVDEVLNLHAGLQQTLGQSLATGESNDADLEDELSELLLRDAPPVPAKGPKNDASKLSFELDDLPTVPRGLPQLSTKNLATE